MPNQEKPPTEEPAAAAVEAKPAAEAPAAEEKAPEAPAAAAPAAPAAEEKVSHLGEHLLYFSYILGAKNSVREQLGPPFKGREDFAPLDVLLHTAGLQPPALNLFEKGGGKELISPADVYI